MTPFKQTHHAQNPVNINVLNFVNQRGSATWLALFTAFGEGDVSSKTATHRFGKKLEYLVYTGRLQGAGRGKARTFCLGPEAGLTVPARGRTTTRTGQCSGVAVLAEAMHPRPLHFAGQLVPPRQFDAMHGDAYIHVLPAPTRPGALDYKRYASLGHQC